MRGLEWLMACTLLVATALVVSDIEHLVRRSRDRARCAEYGAALSHSDPHFIHCRTHEGRVFRLWRM